MVSISLFFVHLQDGHTGSEMSVLLSDSLVVLGGGEIPRKLIAKQEQESFSFVMQPCGTLFLAVNITIF